METGSDAVGRAVQDLIGVLELQQQGPDRFFGRNERNRYGRLFGGQVVAQALRAAAHTVDASRPPHSLHAYFLRSGDVDVPVEYAVDRVRDGRSFATRHVRALQRGEVILNLVASFHVEEPGFEHQRVAMPEAPPPESLPTLQERIRALGPDAPSLMQRPAGRTRGGALDLPPPLETRPVHPPSFLGGGGDHANQIWLRVPRRLPDDPLLHACVLAYASDFALLDVITHGQGPGRHSMLASLDHALWLHGPVRLDQWLLYAQESPIARGARGLARGMVFTAAGRLIASVAQEGLARPA
jgi:acyl-CoA thioesterase-2